MADEKYQCGNCKQFFNELNKSGCCPHCGFWRVDEKDKQVSMKPDNSLTDKLRNLSKELKDDVVLFPQCTFKEAVDNEIDLSKSFVPVNVGEILYFIADMVEK